MVYIENINTVSELIQYLQESCLDRGYAATIDSDAFDYYIEISKMENFITCFTIEDLISRLSELDPELNASLNIIDDESINIMVEKEDW